MILPALTAREGEGEQCKGEKEWKGRERKKEEKRRGWGTKRHAA
jgi:hypothetical protein